MASYVDHFTDTDNTNLASHTPDSGGSWTEVEDSAGTNGFEVQGTNQVTTEVAGSAGDRVVYSVSWTPASNEYDVGIKVDAYTASNAAERYILGRLTGAASFYGLGFIRLNANPDVKLIKVTAGPTRSLIGSANIGLQAAGDIWKFEIRSASKKGYLNQGAGYSEVVSNTLDDDITDVGLAGLGAGAIGDNASATTGSVLAFQDDFTLDDAAGGASLSIPVAMCQYRQRWN